MIEREASGEVSWPVRGGAAQDIMEERCTQKEEGSGEGSLWLVGGST